MSGPEDDEDQGGDTSEEVLRDLNEGGAFIGGWIARPEGTRAYDPQARFRKDILYGRNRDGPERPGVPPAPVRTPPAPPRPAPVRPPDPPAPPRAPAPAQEAGGEANGYWFLRPSNAKPIPASAEERRAVEKKREEEARRADFIAWFRRQNPKASDSDAEVAWQAARRSSTMDA